MNRIVVDNELNSKISETKNYTLVGRLLLSTNLFDG